MKLTRVLTKEQLIDSSVICDELAIAAGLLARRGAKK